MKSYTSCNRNIITDFKSRRWNVPGKCRLLLFFFFLWGLGCLMNAIKFQETTSFSKSSKELSLIARNASEWEGRYIEYFQRTLFCVCSSSSNYHLIFQSCHWARYGFRGLPSDGCSFWQLLPQLLTSLGSEFPAAWEHWCFPSILSVLLKPHGFFLCASIASPK